jgi:hypothetical protein
MEENVNNGPVGPEEEGLMDKAKKLVDKADDFIEENVEKVKKSKAFESLAESFEKAGGYVEDKIEEIKQGGVKEKLEAVADKAEEKAEETLSRLKDLGKKAADKTADKLEDIAGNIRTMTNKDNKPENS